MYRLFLTSMPTPAASALHRSGTFEAETVAMHSPGWASATPQPSVALLPAPALLPESDEGLFRSMVANGGGAMPARIAPSAMAARKRRSAARAASWRRCCALLRQFSLPTSELSASSRARLSPL